MLVEVQQRAARTGRSTLQTPSFQEPRSLGGQRRMIHHSDVVAVNTEVTIPPRKAMAA